MSASIRLREGDPGDVDALLEIARALPAWFNAQGVRHMEIDLPQKRTRAFYRACGFTVLERRVQDNPSCDELLVLKRPLGASA